MRKKLFFLVIGWSISLLAGFLILEIAARVFAGEYRLQNFWQARYDNPVYNEYSADLGWQPKPGFYWLPNQNIHVTVLPTGLRSNGDQNINQANSQLTILAVGDSFTFGGQVNDEETWPAQLEKEGAGRVLNGGVDGYGIDQIVLRAELLASQFHPDVLVVSFIPDDLARTQLSLRGLYKPYFELVEGNLKLHLDHMQPMSPASRWSTRLRKVFGYSYLVHVLMVRYWPDFWSQGRTRTIQVHNDGIAVSCALLDRLTSLAATVPIRKIVLLVQMGSDIDAQQIAMLQPVLACAQRNNLEIVDLRIPLYALWSTNPDEYRTLFRGHMTPQGNAFVANYLVQSGAFEINEK